MRFFLVFSLTLFCIQSKAQLAFIENFKPFCQKSFEGKVLFPEGDKNPFKGQSLQITVAVCETTLVRIPFIVGEDKSRTWVLTIDDNGLLLKHDHRHEDGTPDKITMYGGYANEKGNALQQFFPADEHTATLIPAAATNEWSLQWIDDQQKLHYMLSRNGELRFMAEFDLSTPVK